MASSLRLITSNLLARSIRPTVVSASRFLSIDAGHRSYTTMPEDADFYDQSCVRMLAPKICSMSFSMEISNDRRELSLDTKDENDENGMDVYLYMYGLKKEDITACAERNNIFHMIHNKTDKECCIKLPDKTTSDIKEEMKDGMLEVTLPNEDEFKSNVMANILVGDIIASFREIATKRSWAYYDMFFDQSIMVKRFLPVIAMSSPINSFSAKKGDTAHGLKIKMNMPGKAKIKLTTQGLRVSLEMSGVQRKEVKTFINYDTLVIEGKTKEVHYITGIHLPEGIRKRHNMIKRVMKLDKKRCKGCKDVILHAFVPCYVKNEGIKIN